VAIVLKHSFRFESIGPNMSDDEDYHNHQRKWEELRDWGEKHPEEWEEDELLNNEELLAKIEA
jgi:hypothetical protein